MQTDFSRSDYKRSRWSYAIQCTVQYFITLLMADTFSAKLYMYLGFSQATTGILSSIISLAFIVQFLSVFLVKNKRRAKLLSVIFIVISNILFACLYLTPYMTFLSGEVRRTLALVFVITAYALLNFVSSICFKWANSFVEPGNLGLFTAKKEMISLACSMVFTLAMAYAIGLYEKNGNLAGGFTFISITMFVITLCNFICLMLIKRDPPEGSLHSYEKDYVKAFKYLFTNKGYVKIVVLGVIYYSAMYFIVGFIGAYKNMLLGTVLAATIVNTVASLIRLFVCIPFGKFMDKRSYVKGFELALCISALAYLCCIFTTPATWYLIIGYAVLHAISLAGTENSSTYIVYNYVELDYIEDAIAIKACISGLCGFGAALIAGKVVDLVERIKPVIFGVEIAPQQVLALVSLVLVVAAILFVELAIQKSGPAKKGKKEIGER